MLMNTGFYRAIGDLLSRPGVLAFINFFFISRPSFDILSKPAVVMMASSSFYASACSFESPKDIFLFLGERSWSILWWAV